jgi:hypothetical protein
MYGRRRRPLLGAAVVLGVSSAAAKREVAANNQNQAIAKQNEDLRRSEYERQQGEARHAEERAKWEREKAEQSKEQERGPGGNVKDRGVGNGTRDTDGTTRFCGKCGSTYKVGANFCVGCGDKLSG